MIKKYDFNYNTYDAVATFKVDTNLFKEEDAKLMLEFFSWEYDKDGDPIDELMKKYAITAIKVATSENYNSLGVKSWFAEQEGYMPIDGSHGIELVSVSSYDWDEGLLEMEVFGI